MRCPTWGADHKVNLLRREAITLLTRQPICNTSGPMRDTRRCTLGRFTAEAGLCFAHAMVCMATTQSLRAIVCVCV
jgi:hypothetical protein